MGFILIKLRPAELAGFFLTGSADTPGWGPKYYTTDPSSLSRRNLKKIFLIFFPKSVDNGERVCYNLIKVRETKQITGGKQNGKKSNRI